MSRKVFSAKVSWLLILILFMAFFGPFVYDYTYDSISQSKYYLLGFMIVLFLLILYMFFTTQYVVDEHNDLQIYMGKFLFKKIPIAEIKEISPSRNLLSSPAPSLDRLEIKYGKLRSVLISPKDKIGFVEELQKRNSDIVFN